MSASHRRCQQYLCRYGSMSHDVVDVESCYMMFCIKLLGYVPDSWSKKAKVNKVLRLESDCSRLWLVVAHISEAIIVLISSQ